GHRLLRLRDPGGAPGRVLRGRAAGSVPPARAPPCVGHGTGVFHGAPREPAADPGGPARHRRSPSRMTTTQDAQDFAAYLASLPRVLAGAAALFRDEEGRVLLVEPNYREGWALPGGTIESDDGEGPREGARRETAEEIGLDRELGRLLAVDWVRGAGRPPLVACLYDGGVRGERGRGATRLQEEELLSWRLVPRAELTSYLPGALGRRVLAALDVRDDGSGTAELEDGHRVR